MHLSLISSSPTSSSTARPHPRYRRVKKRISITTAPLPSLPAPVVFYIVAICLGNEKENSKFPFLYQTHTLSLSLFVVLSGYLCLLFTTSMRARVRGWWCAWCEEWGWGVHDDERDTMCRATLVLLFFSVFFFTYFRSVTNNYFYLLTGI